MMQFAVQGRKPKWALTPKIRPETAEKRCQTPSTLPKWALTPPKNVKVGKAPPSGEVGLNAAKTKKEPKSNDFTRHSQTLVGPQKWAVYPFSKTAKLLNCGNPQSFFIVFSLLPEPVLQDELLLRSISVRRISEKSLLGRDVKTIP